MLASPKSHGQQGPAPPAVPAAPPPSCAVMQSLASATVMDEERSAPWASNATARQLAVLAAVWQGSRG